MISNKQSIQKESEHVTKTSVKSWNCWKNDENVIDGIDKINKNQNIVKKKQTIENA